MRQEYINRELESAYSSHKIMKGIRDREEAKKHAEIMEKRREAVARCRPRRIIGRDINDYARLIYVEVALLSRYPELLELLMPYHDARSNARWKVVVDDIDGLVAAIANVLTPSREKRLLERDGKECLDYRCFIKEETRSKVVAFLLKHWEGAYVMPRLLYAAQTGGSGLVIDICHEFSMIGVPGIEGADPLEVFQLIGKVNDVLLAKPNDDTAAFLAFFDFTVHKRMLPDRYGSYIGTVWTRWREFPQNEINGHRAEDLIRAGFAPMWSMPV